MKRPIYTVLEAIRAIKIHATENPNYLKNLYADKDGSNIVLNRVDQLSEATKMLVEDNKIRPVTITTSDQVPNNTFPVIVVNEEIVNDRARIGSGQGTDHFIAVDNTESKMVHNLSDVVVSVSIFSDRRNEVDILGHVMYCGFLGMSSHFNFEGMMNVKTSKQPFRRMFEGMEDVDGVKAVSITIQANINIEVPVIDTTYADLENIETHGIIFV